jgi:hypothetical protein
MSNAIDMIKGYCTEVTQAQWEELVRVADEVGVRMHAKDFSDRYPFFALTHEADMLIGFTGSKGKTIPFPDFLAKLRGVEEWMPKAWEMGRIQRASPTITRAEAEQQLGKRIID